jgi:hypothetical protein
VAFMLATQCMANGWYGSPSAVTGHRRRQQVCLRKRTNKRGRGARCCLADFEPLIAGSISTILTDAFHTTGLKAAGTRARAKRVRGRLWSAVSGPISAGGGSHLGGGATTWRVSISGGGGSHSRRAAWVPSSRLPGSGEREREDTLPSNVPTRGYARTRASICAEQTARARRSGRSGRLRSRAYSLWALRLCIRCHIQRFRDRQLPATVQAGSTGARRSCSLTTQS